jgi:hypothetical protein
VAAALGAGAFAAAVASAVRTFAVVASGVVDFGPSESAVDAGRPAASLALVGERPEVAGEQLQVARAGAQQDGVPDGAEDGQAIDPAGETVAVGAIAGLGTARQVSASRARHTTTATIHTTTATDTAVTDMTTVSQFGSASLTGTHIAWCG